jgi:predicted GH43/DUF377 family glycosyl hydrolase
MFTIAMAETLSAKAIGRRSACVQNASQWNGIVTRQIVKEKSQRKTKDDGGSCECTGSSIGRKTMRYSNAFTSLVMCAIWVNVAARAPAEEAPPAIRAWLGPQKWTRDLDGPTLSLGEPGTFDDHHIFAPCVIKEDGRYSLWYCGSTGSALDVSEQRVRDERVFKLGLATSRDGLHFERHVGPVMEMKDPPRSILTPAILRATDGTPIREAGKLRMWFSTADFSGRTGPHMIREASSADGTGWSVPSESQLQKAYAPSVLKTGDEYQIWYTDVTSFPWKFRHARSRDGTKWHLTPDPVMTLSQPWEARVLVYPCVVQVDDCYLMWYGSYTSDDRLKTAIGFAVSQDGIHWHKHPDNPVLRPRDDRPWESNYVGNSTVLREPDGRFRMWYASRKKPPFRNLYFAINSATWSGPAK